LIDMFITFGYDQNQVGEAMYLGTVYPIGEIWT